jgi:hypothetical protein
MKKNIIFIMAILAFFMLPVIVRADTQSSALHTNEEREIEGEADNQEKDMLLPKANTQVNQSNNLLGSTGTLGYREQKITNLTDTNATFSVMWVNSGNWNLTTYGGKLYNESGSLLASTEWTGSHTSYYLTTECTASSMGYQLIPGTVYQFSLYVVYNGIEYSTYNAFFTTTDSANKYCYDVLETGNNGKPFTISSAMDDQYLIDINGSSKKDSANVQMYAANDTCAQRFIAKFTAVNGSKGYYTIYNAGSGKVLDVTGGNVTSGTKCATI